MSDTPATPSSSGGPERGDPARLLVAASALLLVFTCTTLAWDYSQHSVQMDLSAFYAAGESLRLGLDPYTNNYPAVVTGTDFMHYSGFLYPPLTGLLFKAGAALPYAKFKLLWNFLQPFWAIGIGAIVLVWLRRAGKRSAAAWGVTLFFIVMSAAFPLRVELERGQVDLLLLMLLSGGLLLIEGFDHGFAGGLILGVTPLLKLHTFYLMPFLLLRRRYSAMVGCTLSILLAAGAQYAIFPALSKAYVVDVLPRMEGTAAGQPAEWIKVSPQEWELMSHPRWDQPVERSGHTYLREGFDSAMSVANASLSRNIFLSSGLLAETGRSRLSLAVYAELFLLVFAATKSAAIRWTQARIFAFWIMVFSVVLMAAPLTWTMATVWLLPAAALIPVIMDDEDMPPRRRRTIMMLVVAGVLLAALDERPIYTQIDRRGSVLLMAFLKPAIFFIRVRPVIAEILVCVGMGLYVRSRRVSETRP